MVKSVKFLNMVTAVIFLATLLFVYAFLPIMVNVYPDEYGWSIHKDPFFYYSLVGFLVILIFTIMLGNILSKAIANEQLMAWVRGITSVINLYFAFIVGYVGVVNNPQHFHPGAYSYLNYLGPILVVSWIIGLFYFIFKK